MTGVGISVPWLHLELNLTRSWRSPSCWTQNVQMTHMYDKENMKANTDCLSRALLRKTLFARNRVPRKPSNTHWPFSPSHKAFHPKVLLGRPKLPKSPTHWPFSPSHKAFYPKVLLGQPKLPKSSRSDGNINVMVLVSRSWVVDVNEYVFFALQVHPHNLNWISKN